LYEDVVTNDTLAKQYRQYMIQHLGFEASKMVPVEEAYAVHDQAGSSHVSHVNLLAIYLLTVKQRLRKLFVPYSRYTSNV
jgi:hypothetical protein